MSQNVFFTSDTHVGHGNIIKYCHRPFMAEVDKLALLDNYGKWHSGDWKGGSASKHQISNEAISMMNDAIVNNINSTVGKIDLLYFLGDWCFSGRRKYEDVAKEFRDRVNCENINIVWGNHDKRSIRHLFKESYDQVEIVVNKQKIFLNHYAMLTWDKSHRGSWQLYGHSHSDLEEKIEKMMPGRKAMDVGIDNAAKILGEYRPFGFDEIHKILSKKPGHAYDHHGIRKGPTEEELGS